MQIAQSVPGFVDDGLRLKILVQSHYIEVAFDRTRVKAVARKGVDRESNKRLQLDNVRGVQLCACSFLAFSHTIGPRVHCD